MDINSNIKKLFDNIDQPFKARLKKAEFVVCEKSVKAKKRMSKNLDRKSYRKSNIDDSSMAGVSQSPNIVSSPNSPGRSLHDGF